MSDKLPLKLPVREVFTIVGSRSHMDKETKNFIEILKMKYPLVEIITSGSAMKLCVVAESAADIYPRFGPTMEWDTAAGHCVALAAGFEVIQIDGKSPIVYNKMDLTNPGFIVKSKEFII